MKPSNKKILKISLTAFICLLAVYFIISTYGAYRAMVIPRLPLAYEAEELELPYENVSFKTRSDNLTLYGWYLPGANEQVIIFIHGGFQNRIDDNVDTIALARELAARGYDILLYDPRGRGESEGKGISLSYIDEDLGGAVDYLKGRGYSIENICILGFCSGATNAAIYASRNDIGALILDGCFIDCGTMVIRQANYIHLPGWIARLFIPGGMLTTRIMYGYHRIDPIDVVPDIGSPIFFIHEENDYFTTAEETERLYKASTHPANEYMELPGSDHSRGFRNHPQQYIDRVDGFLQKVYLP